MNDYPYIEKWCQEHSKESGIKMYPQSAPMLPIIEDLLGAIELHGQKMIEMAQIIDQVLGQLREVVALISSSNKSIKKEKKL